MPSQRKIFVTFGGPTENYHNRVKKICEQAESLNIFSEIRGLTDLVLKENHYDFWNNHSEFLHNNKRGYGFWLWKPYIIRSVLQDVEADDIIVYMDSGCTINVEGKQRLNEYIDLLNSQTKFDIISFQMCMLPEVKYSKYALMKHMNVNNEDQHSGQCNATVILIRKGKHSISLTNKWYNIASIYNLINDEHHSQEHKMFIDHRHDQSIFSILVKQMGSIKIPDETYFGQEWNTKGKKYPFWATRIRF
jgi:hypothetical protein